jgi:large subunit ribosomal protein L10
MKREIKNEQVEALKQYLSGARAGLVVELSGVNGPKHDELRRAIRAAGARVRVVKNTLARRAVARTSLEPLQAGLHGPTALIALPGEWHGPLQSVMGYLERDFLRYLPVFVRPAREEGAPPPPRNQPHRPRARPGFVLKAGWLDGRVLSPEEALALARLPSLGASRARLLGLLQTPAAALVHLLGVTRPR